MHFVKREGGILCGLKVNVGAFIDATRTDKLVTCEACRTALSPPRNDRVARWKEAHMKLLEAMGLMSRDPHFDDDVIEDLSRVAKRLEDRITRRKR